MKKSNLQKKVDLLFFQITAIGFVFFAIILFLSINLYPKLFLFSQSLFNKLESICGCADHFSFFNHPFIFTTLIFSSIIMTIFFCWIIFKVVKFRNSTRRFVKINLRNKLEIVSLKLKDASYRVGLKDKIVEVDNEIPIVFCFGLLRPKICISSGLVKNLSKKELRAVLLHEKHHLLMHEPAKLYAVKIIAKILFFLPGLKMLIRQYLTMAELTADERATDSWQNKTALIGALYKVIKWREETMIKNNLALSFFGIINEERINKLSDNRYSPRFKFFNRKLGFSIMLILILPFFINFVTTSNTTSHNSAACPLTHSKADHLFCDMSEVKSVCSESYNIKRNLCPN